MPRGPEGPPGPKPQSAKDSERQRQAADALKRIGLEQSAEDLEHVARSIDDRDSKEKMTQIKPAKERVEEAIREMAGAVQRKPDKSGKTVFGRETDPSQRLMADKLINEALEVDIEAGQLMPNSQNDGEVYRYRYPTSIEGVYVDRIYGENPVDSDGKPSEVVKSEALETSLTYINLEME